MSFFRRLFAGPAPSRASRTSRRLVIDSLESRRLLCDDLTVLPATPLEDPAALVAAPTDVAPAPTDATSPTDAPADPTVAAPPMMNQPPVIVEYRARPVIEVEGGILWEISGRVTDDTLADGVTVLFSGLLPNRHANADNITGVFITTAIFPQGTNGAIPAVAIDNYNAVSASKTVTIQ